MQLACRVVFPPRRLVLTQHCRQLLLVPARPVSCYLRHLLQLQLCQLLDCLLPWCCSTEPANADALSCSTTTVEATKGPSDGYIPLNAYGLPCGGPLPAPAISSTAVGRRCSCGHHASLTCAQCAEAHYCSKSCQVKAWPTHKQDCPEIKEVKEAEVRARVWRCPQCRVADFCSPECARRSWSLHKKRVMCVIRPSTCFMMPGFCHVRCFCSRTLAIRRRMSSFGLASCGTCSGQSGTGSVGRPQATQPKERGRSQSRGCTTVSIQSVFFIIHYSLVVLENMQINQIIKVNSDVI